MITTCDDFRGKIIMYTCAGFAAHGTTDADEKTTKKMKPRIEADLWKTVWCGIQTEICEFKGMPVNSSMDTKEHGRFSILCSSEPIEQPRSSRAEDRRRLTLEDAVVYALENTKNASDAIRLTAWWEKEKGKHETPTPV